MTTIISKSSFKFLKDLQKNNNRDWFNERKPIFKEQEKDVKSFFKEVEQQLQKTDNIEGHKVYRIYNDVRFSKNKDPYKARFAGGFSRATSALRGGYYLNIEPGNSIVGGGFYAPNKEDLLRIRQEFEYDDTDMRKILKNKNFKSTFGDMIGNEVKSAPRGFDPNHTAIDLIKKQQFIFVKHFSDKEVQQEDFQEQVLKTYKTIRPFFNLMSNILTTNSNGESIID